MLIFFCPFFGCLGKVYDFKILLRAHVAEFGIIVWFALFSSYECISTSQIILVIQEATVTLTLISACLKSVSIINAFKDDERAFCKDLVGDCSIVHTLKPL